MEKNYLRTCTCIFMKSAILCESTCTHAHTSHTQTHTHTPPTPTSPIKQLSCFHIFSSHHPYTHRLPPQTSPSFRVCTRVLSYCHTPGWPYLGTEVWVVVAALTDTAEIPFLHQLVTLPAVAVVPVPDWVCSLEWGWNGVHKQGTIDTLVSTHLNLVNF